MKMMRLIIFIALFAFACAELRRIPLIKKQNHVLSIDNIRVERNYLLEKYHWTTVEDDTRECVENMDQYINNQYYAQIPVGTPPQILNTVLDTTGFITYVSEKNTASWSGFDAKASSTANIVDTSAEVFVGYSNTQQVGNNTLIKDVFDISGINVTIEFALNDMIYDNAIMVFGLGYKYGEVLAPPLYYMKQQQILENLEYSIYYDTTEGTDFGGHVIFGGSDPSVYSGELTKLSMSSFSSAISITIDSFSINGVVTNTETQAIIDSSSNLISVPVLTFIDISKEIHGIIDDEGHYFVDCNQIDTFPDVTVKLGGSDFTIPPQSYILRVSKGLTPCMSAFTYHTYNMINLGLPFLTQVYTVVNFKEQTIAFAKLA